MTATLLAPEQEAAATPNVAYLVLEPGQIGPHCRSRYVPYRGPVNPVADPVVAEWIAERAKRHPYIGSTPRRTSGDPDNPQYSAAAGLDRHGMMLRSEDGPGNRRYYFAEPLANLPREQWPDVSRYVFGEWAE